MIMVGAANIEDSIELAKHAEAAGADAISSSRNIESIFVLC
jgi:dihydrodipicolinate synthase/N-acetylneuraminate lyase